MPSAARHRHQHWLIPLGIFCVATLLRLSFFVELQQATRSTCHYEGGDSLFYDHVAAGAEQPSRAYFHSPLYQGFVANIYRLAGLHNRNAVRLLQHLLGAATAVLVYLIALRLFGRRGLALLAGVLQATLGPLLLYEGELLVDGLLPCCVALTAWLTLEHYAHAKRWSALALGAALGLTALGRPNVLIWVPLLFTWLLLRPPVPAQRAWSVGLLAAGLLAVIVPVTVRNYVVERDLVLISSNWGLNLYLGNGPGARGVYRMPPGLHFRPGEPADDFSGVELARRALGREPRSSEVAAWWARQTLAYVRERPARSLALLFTKLQLLVNNYEQPDLYHQGAYRELCPTLRWLAVPGLVLAPALVGLLGLLRQRARREQLLFVALALAYGASLLPFFIAGRYRAPWFPLLAPLAAWTLVQSVAVLQRREVKQSVVLLLALAVAVLTCAWPAPVRISPAAQQVKFGATCLARGQLAEALRWYEQALALEPRSVLAHQGRGLVLAKQGRFAESSDELRRAAALDPRSATVQINLGSVLLGRGELRAAAESYRQALQLAAPGESWLPALRQRLQQLEERLAGSPTTSSSPRPR